MANEFGLVTYGDTSRREDLTDLLKNISPVDTPFTTGISHGEPVTATLHEWQEDVLDDRATNAFPEGHTATYTALDTPSRIVNVTQILRKDGNVSNTQRAVNHAGFKDQLAYQQGKKTKAFKNDLEFAAVLSTLDTGASGTARAMKGALAMITSVTTALSSQVLSETIYNDMLQLRATSFGGDVDEIYAGFWLKRKISGFTAGATKNVDIKDKRLTNTVSVYEGDFGIQKIFKLRELNSTGGSTAKMFGIRSDVWRLGWLRRPQMNIVPPDGSDTSKFYIVGEATLVNGADGANVKWTGLNNAT